MSDTLNSYFTIDKPSYTDFKDRGSRFLAYAYPLPSTDAFKSILAGLKKEHPKANHHCFAYRLGTIGDNYRVSDDGEPSGTAGRPILGQIDSKNLTNVLVVVVRYFGGTLLGVPGLINAYKTATSLALQLAPVIEKQIEISYQITCSYPQLNDVMTILKQHQCIIQQQEMGLFCTIKTGISMSALQEVKERLTNIFGVELIKLV